MTFGWTDCQEGQALISLVMPRRLYEKLKAYGEPREIINEALQTDVRLLKDIRIGPIEAGATVIVPMVVDEWTARAIRDCGLDDYLLEQITEYLETLEPPEPISTDGRLGPRPQADFG